MEIVCNRCGTPKEKDDFPKSLRKINNIDSTCKACRKKMNDERKAKKKIENELYGFQSAFV